MSGAVERGTNEELATRHVAIFEHRLSIDAFGLSKGNNRHEAAHIHGVDNSRFV
jgi:hypothetical protein